MNMLVALLSTAALSIAVPAFAQEQASASPQTPAELGDVEVTGRRLEPQVQSFIDDIAAPPRGRGLARWDRTICVGVANMDERYAQFMVDRVAKAAVDVGLEVGEPGCRPDIMVVASADAKALASALVDDNPQGFRPARSNTDLGSQALRRFKTTDAPVRWWHVSLPVSADTGEIAVRLDNEEPPTITVRDASRLRSNIRDDLARVIIILDVSKIGTVGFGALSDYVAMIALAQVEPDADANGYDSVLNLFSPEADRLAGLTQWDRDYLASLYRANRNRARPTQQARDIVRGMVGERDDRVEANDRQP
ncbi:hypothetical protein EGY25_15255 [Brevundimonas intermedia]|uniref:DUF2927 domain-containing protein n=1 Tax=Brevundimonas intermedia TaxID=74315 RepID=A0A4Y9RTZ8_9CAUL|nr:hypothetical protein [Brevundimonas intermedia]TFW11039.1 hypothetical protein EGY25_15255 [Brevundimonas intermedia]